MIQFKKQLISVIIRTLNEEKHLHELLEMIHKQITEFFDIETVIVDSGSTDKTLEIAAKFNSRITHIKKKNFSFGRSLNIGCEFAKGDFLVFVSGHCIPTNQHWLNNLVMPLYHELCDYSYGRQEGKNSTKFSEKQLFLKFFPLISSIPQEGFFCNNANSALKKSVWKKYSFDEYLTGCEDMDLAKKIVKDGLKIGYVADASVFHIHDESWKQVKIRYEREALALQKIMPEVRLTIFDVLKYFIVSLIKDCRVAILNGIFLQNIWSIIMFRWSQYYGTYIGNNYVFDVSREVKNRYFYPRVSDMEIKENYND